MSLRTAWVEPITQITGQDHLGTIAAGERIYTLLLPGITNVTERARCYSFYPWLLWAFDRHGLPKDAARVTDALRRAECLMCLVGAAHEKAGDDPRRHGIGLAGRDALLPAWRRIEEGGVEKLSRYATLDDTDSRYFKNRLGALGQYYFGTLRDLGILDSEGRRELRYVRTNADPLGEALESCVPGARFFDALEVDRVSRDTLRALSAFCPCRVAGNDREREALLDVFFSRTAAFQGPAGTARVETLTLLLSLAAGIEKLPAADRLAMTTWTVRDCCYSGAVVPGTAWALSERLERTRRRWSTYQRAELLSLAVQGLFWAALDGLAAAGTRPRDAADLGDWFGRTFAPLVAKRPEYALSAFLSQAAASLPPRQFWNHPLHEQQLVRELRSARRIKDPDARRPAVVKSSVGVLVALLARGETGEDGPWSEAEDLPINLTALHRLAETEWRGLDVAAWLSWLVVHWGVEVHFHVALRKLRSEGLDTFRIRPAEEGLEVVEPAEPAATQPRIGRAIRILADLGAIDLDLENAPSVTRLGRDLLRKYRD